MAFRDLCSVSLLFNAIWDTTTGIDGILEGLNLGNIEKSHSYIFSVLFVNYYLQSNIILVCHESHIVNLGLCDL